MAFHVSDILPSAALTFGILFTILLIIHICLQIRYRVAYWSILAACTLSAVAYYSKLVAYEPHGEEAETLGAWICFVVSGFMAPFFINVYLYTLLRRLHLSFIPIEAIPTNPATIFWWLQSLNAVVWVLQILAVSFLWWMPYAPTYMLFASFICQLLVNVVFLILLAKFHLRASKHRKAGTLLTQMEGARDGTPVRSYKPMVVVMYMVPIFLSIRAVYYLVNCGTPYWYFDGRFEEYWDDSYYRNDWTLKWWEPGQIGLDATPVLLALVVLAWPTANPGRTFKRKDWRVNIDAWRYGAQGPPVQQQMVGGVDAWRYGAQGPLVPQQSYGGVEAWRYGAQGPPGMQQKRLGDGELARELELRNLRAVPREQTLSYLNEADGTTVAEDGGTHAAV